MSYSKDDVWDFAKCTKNGIPCDCKDCDADQKCKELECAICGNCDEYWPAGRCDKKHAGEASNERE